MQQISPNLYVDTQFSIPPVGPGPYGCNCSFIVTSEGIVMIDTPALPTYAARWREEITRRGEIRYIINTEYHPDHIMGNYFFPGIVVSHQGVKEQFRAPVTEASVVGQDLVEQPGKTYPGKLEYYRLRVSVHDPAGLPALENYQFKEPTITFSDKLNLYLGEHTFELIHLPGHTPYEVGVYVPQERVVFTGDNFTNKWQPALAHCCPLEWIESLKKIEALDVDLIVPGHGQIGDKKALRECAAFIQGVVDAVRKAINKGLSKEEAANTISFESKLPAAHPGSEQQRMNVKRVYEMLSKKQTC